MADIIDVTPICFGCKHLDDKAEVGFKCKAFKAIPFNIWNGLNDHSKPLKSQKNNIVFESR